MKPLHTSKNTPMGYSAAYPTMRRRSSASEGSLAKDEPEGTAREPRAERIDYGKMCECALPEYLAADLRAYKEGCERGSSLLDCLWGELYGSINIAEINDNAITHAQAQYLRDKYLFGRSSDD